MIKPINQVAFTFPSYSSNEGFARASVASFVAQLDPTLDELNDVKTAISEGVTNAIVHAYPDTIGKICIKLKLFEGGKLEISIQDWGVGISDINEALTPLFTTGNEDRSGMGFTIMESFMDDLRVRSKPNKGTLVVLRRKFRRRMA